MPPATIQSSFWRIIPVSIFSWSAPPENLGFAAANNRVFEEYRGAPPLTSSLSIPIPASPRTGSKKLSIDDCPEAGIAASRMLSIDGTATDSAGDIFGNTMKAYKRCADDSQSFLTPETIFGACGGAALYRVSMLEKIGFFDEDFFLLCEDTDLNLRAWFCGYSCRYCPEAVVYHHSSASIGRSSAINVYYTQRNIEYVRLKNLPLKTLLLYGPLILFSNFADFIWAVKTRHPLAWLRAKFTVLLKLPQLLRKRRTLRRLQTNDNIAAVCTSVFNAAFFSEKLRKLRGS